MIGKTNASAGSPTTPTSGDWKVTTIDHLGIVNEQWVNNGQNAIEPTPKTYAGLTFFGFNSSYENITENKTIGAIYNTTDGKTKLRIRLTTVSGLAPTLYLYKYNGATMTIDWGDSTQNTYTNNGVFNTGPHTYSVIGEYDITIWISSGTGTYTLSSGNSSSSVVGGTNATYRNTLISVNVGANVADIRAGGFINNKSLKSISIASAITTIYGNVFSGCLSLDYIAYPILTTSFDFNVHYGNYSLKKISAPSLATTEVEDFAFCYSLQSETTTGVVATIATNMYNRNYNIRRFTINSSITSIGASAFEECVNITEYIINRNTPPTLVNISAFTAINPICRIYVPDAYVDTYKGATNWSTYANYIYPLSTL